MLQYIYPKPTPVVSSLELLNDALRVANKYRLESMKSRLREQLVLPTSPVSVHSAPIGTFYAVLNNGLAAEAKLAASLVREKCQPATEEGLRRLLDAAPSPTSAALVELNGIYLVKMKVLVEVLFQFEGAPMTIASDKRSLICSVCQIAMKTSSWPAPPQWQVRWARWIFGCISQRPIAIWEGFFDHSHVHTAFYQQFPLSPPTYYSQTKGFDSTTLHCSCISVVQLPGTRAAFQSWANGVYEHLRSRLAFIAELETQRHSDWPEVNN
ncbi:hypothetical protein B0J17DRAFT_681860 [Rhizoctonia solani]|nr:hypothetical protein B0J17DRAFT_681860 [Rhizoctonia solani]